MAHISIPIQVALVLLLGLIAPATTGAETFYLRDGSSFEGTMVHYYENSVQLTLASGDTLIINRNELARIEFGSESTKSTTHPVRPKTGNANPTQVVEAWIRALKKGDFEAMASYFIDSARTPMLEKLREIGESQRQQMIAEAKKTEFKLGDLQLNGDRARIKLTRTLRQKSSDEELFLQLDGGTWKLLPND